MSGYFISGTDTEIGKTVVTLALMAAMKRAGVKVCGMKPVASGCTRTSAGLRNEDALQIQAANDVEHSYNTINPYAFEPAVAPHVAAMEAGVVIDFENIKACYQLLAASTDNVVVEGVGGWKVPLGQNQAVPDLALALQLPVIMVVGLRIGCINHAVLTAEAIKRDGLQLKAWVASQLEPVYPTLDPSLEYLKAKIGAPMLGYIPFSETLNFADMGAKLDLGLL